MCIGIYVQDNMLQDEAFVYMHTCMALHQVSCCQLGIFANILANILQDEAALAEILNPKHTAG